MKKLVVLGMLLLSMLLCSAAYAADLNVALGETVYSTLNGDETDAVTFTNTTAAQTVMVLISPTTPDVSLFQGNTEQAQPLNVTYYDENGDYRGTASDHGSVLTLATGGLDFTFHIAANAAYVGYSLSVLPLDRTNVLAGLVTMQDSSPAINAIVTAYTTDGKLFSSTLTNDEGKYSMTLPYGAYNLAVSLGEVKLFYSASPADKATTVYVTSKTAAKNFRVGDTRPEITGLSAYTVAKGTALIITGSGFGTKKSYIFFNGYETNTASAISIWGNNKVVMKVPTGAISGCLKLFNPETGYSNCVDLTVQSPVSNQGRGRSWPAPFKNEEA